MPNESNTNLRGQPNILLYACWLAVVLKSASDDVHESFKGGRGLPTPLRLQVTPQLRNVNEGQLRYQLVQCQGIKVVNVSLAWQLLHERDMGIDQVRA